MLVPMNARLELNIADKIREPALEGTAIAKRIGSELGVQTSVR